MAHREEGDVSHFEDVALDQPADVAEEVSVFVLSDTVVQLEIESLGKWPAATRSLFRPESPVQHFACHVVIRVHVLVRQENVRLASMDACDVNVDLQAIPVGAVFLAALPVVWKAMWEFIRTF